MIPKAPSVKYEVFLPSFGYTCGATDTLEKAIKIANQLIDEGYSIHIDTLKKSEKKQLKNAIKMNASFYLRCNELIELKNLSSKEECVINNITDLKKFIKS